MYRINRISIDDRYLLTYLPVRILFRCVTRRPVRSHAGGRVLKHCPLAARRRLVPLVGAAALVLATIGFGGSASAAALGSATAGRATGSGATGPAVSATSGPHRSVYDPVTGKDVTVYKPAATTPVHPKKLTHPQDDWMGGVTGGHGGGHA